MNLVRTRVKNKFLSSGHSSHFALKQSLQFREVFVTPYSLENNLFHSHYFWSSHAFVTVTVWWNSRWYCCCIVTIYYWSWFIHKYFRYWISSVLCMCLQFFLAIKFSQCNWRMPYKNEPHAVEVTLKCLGFLLPRRKCRVARKMFRISYIEQLFLVGVTSKPHDYQ